VAGHDASGQGAAATVPDLVRRDFTAATADAKRVGRINLCAHVGRRCPVVGTSLICEDAPPSRPKEHFMASRLNPYISFSDNARQAMEFYKDVFGGALTLSTYGEFGAPDGAEADKIMHGMLETDNGFTLMAADTPGGTEHIAGTNIAVSLSGDDSGDLHGYWDKLSEGGMVSVPLQKQMWGDEFGACVDRFGISWMVNVAQPQA
jgi:PhnB protein